MPKALPDLVASAVVKTNFTAINDYIDFAREYLEFIAQAHALQARIVSRNEPHYNFFQYPVIGNHNFTRPINTNLFYDLGNFDANSRRFTELIASAREATPSPEDRALINRVIYTAQQCIGATLDALPAGQSNTARKVNGDLFERFIRLIISQMGISCTSGTVQVPVMVGGQEQFRMAYQHDLIIKEGELVKAIGSVKTTSKDRIDKIFMDKFLLARLTGKDIPHVAIFLNDVQRAGKEPRFRISATFLPGHFKGYTVKLNPLDGVYYCDIRPMMSTEPIIKDHIKTFDHFIFDDVWPLLRRDAIEANIEPNPETDN